MMVVEARKVGRTKDKASPKVRKWVMGLPARNLRREELDKARLFCFVPQKHFYGGYLVYALKDKVVSSNDKVGVRTYRQWVANYAARGLGVTFTVAI